METQRLNPEAVEAYHGIIETQPEPIVLIMLKAHPLKTAHSNPPFKYRRLVCAFNSMTLATYKVLVVFLRHCAFRISGFFVRKKVVIERRMRIFLKARGIFCALQTMRF
jgi:hypothetical protein